MGNGGTETDKNLAVVKKPFSAIDINLQTAKEAYEAVLNKVGASFKRDSLDARIIVNVQQRTGQLIDVQGGYPHGTVYELTINAWPVLQSNTALGLYYNQTRLQLIPIKMECPMNGKPKTD